MADANGAPTRIHLSKGAIERWERCPLAYKYERIDKLNRDGDRSLALVRGTAAHEAAASVLKAHADPDTSEANEIVDETLGTYLLPARDARDVADLALAAVDAILGRDGRVRFVETLCAMRIAKDTIVWGKFDVAVVGGRIAPLEIIDLKFAQSGCATPEELEEAPGGRIYALLGHHVERDQAVRPIAVSELNIAKEREVIIWPSMEQLTAWRGWLKATADKIRRAIRDDRFDAHPGPHCGWCPFRDICPMSSPAGPVVGR